VSTIANFAVTNPSLETPFKAVSFELSRKALVIREYGENRGVVDTMRGYGAFPQAHHPHHRTGKNPIF
jgi:hypothetical protein